MVYIIRFGEGLGFRGLIRAWGGLSLGLFQKSLSC